MPISMNVGAEMRFGMKEQEMIHKLVEEEIEIPEGIQPENIYKQLLEMDNEQGGQMPLWNLLQGKKSGRGGSGMWKRMATAGTAIAAGLLVCVLAAMHGPVYTCRSNQSYEEAVKQELSEQNTGYEAAGSTKAEENTVESRQDYQLVYQRLQKIANKQETFEKEKDVESVTEEVLQEQDYRMDSAGTDAASVSKSKSKNVTASSSLNEASGAAKTSETNVRTQGVDEGDIVKTDGEYIYAYRYDPVSEASYCYIYQAKQEKTKKIAKISFPDKRGYEYDLQDMYLAEGKLVLIAGRTIDSDREKPIKELYQKAGGDYKNFCRESWAGPYGACVVEDKCFTETDDTESPWVDYSTTLIYDISNPLSPVLEKELFQDGSYESSRMVDGKLYLMSRRYMNIDRIDLEREESFIPQIGGKCVTPDKVDMASENEEGCYQVLSSVDVASGDYIDKKAVLGGGGQIYVSEKSIYLVDGLFWDDENRTILLKYSYEEGKLKKEAEGKIKGHLKDDYAVDERDGYLRAVTTYYNKRGTEKNAVYILDDQLKKTGQIENIAPKESVYAVRFMGDLVYFVTFEQTDPVFVADLSKPSAPEIIGELKLPGFSCYLHPIGDDLMVGIGAIDDEEEGVKLSLFDTSDPKNIKEIHKKVLKEYEYSEVMENPNALFIDADRQLLGFSAGQEYDRIKFDYLVYEVDRDKGFVQKCKSDVLTKHYGEMAGIRGLYIENYFYIVNPGKEIGVYRYPGFEKIS